MKQTIEEIMELSRYELLTDFELLLNNGAGHDSVPLRWYRLAIYTKLTERDLLLKEVKDINKELLKEAEKLENELKDIHESEGC